MSNTLKFIQRSNETHNSFYNYLLTEYTNCKTKVKIICPMHGVFEQTPTWHIRGSGCPICANINRNKKSSNKEFTEKASIVHNNEYDYSLVNYVNNKTKVKIICKEHGVFEQKPDNHLQGQKCKKCNADKARSNNAQFITKARATHGGVYDYSLVNYVNNKTKVKIICKEHGVFEQKPILHLEGAKCPKCKIAVLRLKSQQSHNKTKNQRADNFIKKANFIHNNKYDYSLTEYNNNATKVNIVCKTHGIFRQAPSKHLAGRGCPTCRESQGEKAIAKWLEENNIKFEREKRIKEFSAYKKFDFYLPRYDIYIEYDGIQHFIPTFGSKAFINAINTDVKRNNWCKENNVKLFIITYLDNIEYFLNNLIKLG